MNFPSSKPTTDPGLGPRPASDPPPPPSGRAHGVIVPAAPRVPIGPSAITPPEFRPIARSSASSPSKKDSVELLLEGMAGPRPDRRRTTPQSDGEASAAYHAEHGLRPARPSSEPGPKVVVERPSPSRPRLAGTAPGKALPGSREALSTFVPGKVLRRRVAIAIVAGVLIVFMLFVGFRLTVQRPGAGAGPGASAGAGPGVNAGSNAEPAANAGATGAPETTGAVSAAPTGAPQETTQASAALPVPAEPAEPAEGTNAGEPGTAGHTRGHHHHVHGDDGTSGTGDLGEFKSKF